MPSGEAPTEPMQHGGHVALAAPPSLYYCLLQPVPVTQELRRWAGDKLAPYKLPSVVRVLTLAELPRNAMGKVNKKALRAEYFAGAPAATK
jgi:acyl-CoA synthetase (AMP-forming)/AMP-acid ligase II